MNLHNIFYRFGYHLIFRGNTIIEAGITKPPEVIIHIFFLSLCLFLSLCFHAIKGIRLKPIPYKLNDFSFSDLLENRNVIVIVTVIVLLQCLSCRFAQN